MRGGSICWVAVLGALIHIWRPETAEGRHFLFVDMAGDGFISHSNHTYQPYLLQAALKALSLRTSLFTQGGETSENWKSQALRS